MEWQLLFLLLTLHLCNAHQVDDNIPFPMHTAVSKGDLRLVMHLLKGGANINQQNAGWLYTPLHSAAYYGRSDITRYLLENGASKTIRNYEDRTALEEAAFLECNKNAFNTICKEAPWNYAETVRLLNAECVSSIMCRSDLNCVNQRCVNPCLGYCGVNTNCRIQSQQPFCTCKIGYTGVAKTGCQRTTEIPRFGCTSDSQCESHKFCAVNGVCRDVCSKETCKENEVCKVGALGGFKTPHCTCSAGFFVDTDQSCKKSGCINHSECADIERCESGSCVDPCTLVTCGQGARCRVIQRRPQCFCPVLTQGNPLVHCQPARGESHAPSENRDMCQVPSEIDTNVTIIKCGTEETFDVDERILHLSGQGSNCGSNNQVPVGTHVIVSCWQSPSITARCTKDNSWAVCNATSCQPPFTTLVHLCQQEAPNAQYCGNRPSFSPSSSAAFRQQWPWMVGIFVNDKYVCTGTVISVRYVLTAAHCTAQSRSSSQPIDVRDIKLQHAVGDEIIKSRINKIIHHPKFRNADRPEKDISLLRLENPITFSKSVMPACIAKQQPAKVEYAVAFDRNEGETDFQWQRVLQKLDNRCQTGRAGNACQLEIKDRQFCSTSLFEGFSQVIEQGSSGGPYIVNTGTERQEQQRVVGVVSYHVKNSCKEPYTVYTDVTAFSRWIEYCLDTALDAPVDCHGYTGF